MDGKVPTFVIHDVPKDAHEDIVEFMTTQFCRDEVTCECVGILEGLLSILELQGVKRKILKHNMTLLDEVENDEDGYRPRIAGCNVTSVCCKDEKNPLDVVKINTMHWDNGMEKN